MRGSEGPGEVLSDDSVLPADSNPSSSLCVNKQDPKWFHQRCNVQCPHTKRKCMPQVCATAEDVNATELTLCSQCQVAILRPRRIQVGCLASHRGGGMQVELSSEFGAMFSCWLLHSLASQLLTVKLHSF